MANKVIQLQDNSNNLLFPKTQLAYQTIFYERKPSTQVNTWYKSNGTFTITTTTLIAIEVLWTSHAPLAVAVVKAEFNSHENATYIHEVGSQFASIKELTILESGTYAVWLKLNGIGNGDPVRVIKICELG